MGVLSLSIFRCQFPVMNPPRRRSFLHTANSETLSPVMKVIWCKAICLVRMVRRYRSSASEWQFSSNFSFFAEPNSTERERERVREREIRGERRRKKKEEEKEAAQSWRESSAQPYYYAYCATAHVLHTHTHKSPLRHLKSRKRSSFFLINVSSEVLPSVAPAPLHALVIE